MTTVSKRKVGAIFAVTLFTTFVITAGVTFRHELGQYGSTVLTALNSISPQAWAVIVESVFAAFLVSPFAAAIKKWASVDGELKMLSIVGVLSFLGGCLGYIHGNTTLALWFAPIQGIFVFAATQPVFFAAVKPGIRKFSTWFTVQLTKAQGSLEAQNAKAPQDGVVLSTASDFSH